MSQPGTMGEVEPLFIESLTDLAKPLQGMRVLLFGFSARGFPGGDGVAEALKYLPKVGVDVQYSHEIDQNIERRIASRYDVLIVGMQRVPRIVALPKEIWRCASTKALWFWDLRPSETAEPMRGLFDHAFIPYSDRWETDIPGDYDPKGWADTMGCPVGYCPQGSSLKWPRRSPGYNPRVLFVGDLKNQTYHRDRDTICRGLSAEVLNSRSRKMRLEYESKLPILYPSAKYCLSMSPPAPGYTSVRTYSILGCGGLLLLKRFPGCEDLFTDGEDAVVFDTLAEAERKIGELNHSEKLRHKMADAGRRRHARSYTLSHRVLEICKRVAA